LIENAAVVDSARPQLIGGRLIRSGFGQTAIDNDLSYDALIVDPFGLRGSIQWAGGECGHSQQRSRSERGDPKLSEHLAPHGI
jgi:hypothetical protein